MREQELQDTPWHTRPGESVVEALATDPERGLSTEEARKRLERHGPNRVRKSEGAPWWRILLRQFLDPLIYVLIVAGLVMMALQDFTDALVILAVVVINGAIGFVQEYRAQKAITALAEMSAPRAPLRRDGRETEVDTGEVVPGDVVRLSSGVRVPADVRLLEAEELRVDESALTGESEAVAKQSEPVDDEKAVPGDQPSMAFAGTNVTRGRGLGVVVHTGQASQLGRIAEKTREVGTVRTPIQVKMDRLGKRIGLAILILAGLVGVAGGIRGLSLYEIVHTAVAMAVGAVPEALPVVLTVALAVGVRRMARRNAVIRTLPSVETLGSTTVVGSDKTGTLTSGRMTVRTIRTLDRRYRVEGQETAGDHLEEDVGLRLTLLAGLLANETAEVPGDDDGPGGDPTEVAVLTSAARAGLDPERTRREHERLDIIPFESDRQYMATLNRTDEGPRIFVKGAPEAVLERCSHRVRSDGTEEELDRESASEAAYELAEEGHRVLAMAYRSVDRERFEEREEVGASLVLAGFQGIQDPLRDEAKEAVDATRRAGIRVVMLTGDHADTAGAIGRELGLVDGDSGVREGRELEDLSREELDDVVRDVDVYARVSPDHKLRLVERLKDQGEIVAVTGDGVNDAPALQAAHLGVAMGQAGTDVARETSDMILTDDNYASITASIEEGRLVFSNIRKVTYFLLSTGVAEVLTILFSLFAGWPLPFIAVQVLWINLVTNGLQDVALAFEKAEPGFLDEPPRDPGEDVINRELAFRLAWISVLIAGATLCVFYWLLRQDLPMEEVRSVAMTQMVMFQCFHVFNSRSLRRSVFRTPLSANPFLVVSIVVAILAHLAALHIPFMQDIFRTTPLGLEQWGVVTGIGALVIAAVEGEKAWLRRTR